MQERTKPISSHLDQTSLANYNLKDFIIQKRDTNFLQDIACNPEGAVYRHLPSLRSQSQQIKASVHPVHSHS